MRLESNWNRDNESRRRTTNFVLVDGWNVHIIYHLVSQQTNFEKLNISVGNLLLFEI